MGDSPVILRLFAFLHPRQIHDEQSQSDGREETEDIELFTQNGGKGAGNDIAIGVIEEIEVCVKWLI